jgi:hypothetical protein
MAGAATTLTVIALLSIVILRPAEIAVAPYPDIIEFATIVPERTPDVPHPVAQPAPKIDLPMPVVALKLPEFATPVETPALPALALNPSPDAVARPSGAEAPYGKTDGTGRIAGFKRLTELHVFMNGSFMVVKSFFNGEIVKNVLVFTNIIRKNSNQQVIL